MIFIYVEQPTSRYTLQSKSISVSGGSVARRGGGKRYNSENQRHI